MDATSEGMTFYPGGNGKCKGQLFVAYGLVLNRELKEKRSSVHIYDVPDAHSKEKTLSTVSKLSAPVLNQGLMDSKITDMQYFEHVMYVLFDNAEVIRDFDLSSRNLLKEWKIPVVPGFEKQWEGMNLERVVHFIMEAFQPDQLLLR